jgi:hypothetical protein
MRRPPAVVNDQIGTFTGSLGRCARRYKFSTAIAHVGGVNKGDAPARRTRHTINIAEERFPRRLDSMPRRYS